MAGKGARSPDPDLFQISFGQCEEDVQIDSLLLEDVRVLAAVDALQQTLQVLPETTRPPPSVSLLARSQSALAHSGGTREKRSARAKFRVITKLGTLAVAVGKVIRYYRVLN